MSYAFSIVKKDGSRKVITANSANHAKQERAKVIKERPLLISPIINLDHHGKSLPGVFGANLKRIRGVL